MEIRSAKTDDMINDKEEHKTEILIIRRHSGDDHAGHKGGAWKIAYADFVTAMMAFFLVMWLINSANEVTKSRVASYFNPIKMTDAAPAGKGLKDNTPIRKTENKTKTDAVGEKPGEATDNKNSGIDDTPNTSAGQATDETLRNPYKMIEQISQEGQDHPSGKTVDVVTEKTGDPFDPKAWEALREGRQNSDVPSGVTTLASDAQDLNLPTDNQNNPQVANVAPNSAPDDVLIKPTIEFDQAGDKTNPAVDIGKPSVAKTSTSASNDVVMQAEKEIKAAIADAGAQNDLQASVQKTSEGLLIVLSDASTHPMFAIGSAKPTPALIEVIDTVGKILGTQDGQVVVRGHTDARRYKSMNFDNWQLSTARAHMASYILMHGGLDEKKILKIEGYGSSEPLDAADPLADANRRVEFLLRK
jgi:chemotaxis protein MotB